MPGELTKCDFGVRKIFIINIRSLNLNVRAKVRTVESNAFNNFCVIC